jgi:hypothetical protein
MLGTRSYEDVSTFEAEWQRLTSAIMNIARQALTEWTLSEGDVAARRALPPFDPVW